MVADLHPDVAELEAFLLGTLSDVNSASVEAHLAVCSACQERAANTVGDSLVSLLAGCIRKREAGPPTPSLKPPRGARPMSRRSRGEAGSNTTVVDRVPQEFARHQRYRVVRLLGEGGMGSVYEAEHRVMQRPVA